MAQVYNSSLTRSARSANLEHVEHVSSWQLACGFILQAAKGLRYRDKRKAHTEERTDDTKLWSPNTLVISALPPDAEAAAAAACIDICRAAQKTTSHMH